MYVAAASMLGLAAYAGYQAYQFSKQPQVSLEHMLPEVPAKTYTLTAQDL